MSVHYRAMRTQVMTEKYGRCNLVIKGLDPSVDDKMLFEIFNQFGRVKSAKVPQSMKVVDSEEGGIRGNKMVMESRGIGFVLFESEDVAADVKL